MLVYAMPIPVQPSLHSKQVIVADLPSIVAATLA